MSVEHGVVRGFGFVLSKDEVEACLRHLNIEWDHDEPEVELLDHFVVEMSQCGNGYVENGLRYLYHARESRDSTTGSTHVDEQQVAELKRMITECKLDKTVGFQQEKHLY